MTDPDESHWSPGLCCMEALIDGGPAALCSSCSASYRSWLDSLPLRPGAR